MLLSYQGHHPILGSGVFVAHNADLIGRVEKTLAFLKALTFSATDALSL